DFAGADDRPMEFPPFEHLRFYEGVHDVRLNISYSNIKGFTLGEFHQTLPKDLDLNWTDERGPPELRRLLARHGRVAMDHVLANLNNPTSVPIGRNDLQELADIAQECDGYVLVDETFRELTFHNPPPSVAEFGPRMIALSTVTKVGGLGALRVGWIVAHPRLLDQFKAVKDYTTVCGSSVSQLLAMWALQRWSFFRRRAKNILDRNRKLVEEALPRMPALRGEVPKSGSVMFPHSD